MDDTIKLAIETIAQNKQAIVFCASRASAEKTAEDIAAKIHMQQNEAKEHAISMSEKCVKVVSPATKQCKRLAKMLNKQIAFHHSGLHSKQKETIENEFKEGNIKIICATPTLAAGLSLPVFRVICKSLKRFSGRFGMNWIPVLEYLQMAGRAGRPEYEKFGEAIAIARNEGDKEEIYQRYVCGEPEEIYSKLNVEPVLRMYLLSLIASGIIKDKVQMSEFFEETFWAHQFGDMDELEEIMQRMLKLLEEWEFIVVGDVKETDSLKTRNKNKEKKQEGINNANNLFTSALEIVSKKEKNAKVQETKNSQATKLHATRLGRRISELYLDPLTANHLINCLDKAQYWLESTKEKVTEKEATNFSYLQAIANTLEMRPLLRIKSKEQKEYENILLQHYEELLQEEPDVFDLEYSDFMNSIKTTEFFNKWINEVGEDKLLEEMGIRPGEIRVKLEIANWLLYSCSEISKVLNYKTQLSSLQKLKTRVKFGVREEILPLLKIKGVGRARARKLYLHKFKTISDLKLASQTDLGALLGPRIAASIKEQLGQTVEEIPKGKRKGQLSLEKFGKKK